MLNRHMKSRLLLLLLLFAAAARLWADSIISVDSNNIATVTFRNEYYDGVCTLEGRIGRRWVPIKNFWATQRLDQVSVQLPRTYRRLRFKCMSIAPGNAFTRMALAYGDITTVAGRGEVLPGNNGWVPEYEGAPAISANLSDPRYAVADEAGNIYVVERDGHAVDKITPDGTIHTLIGQHTPGFVFDLIGHPARETPLHTPSGLCIAGNFMLVLDVGNNRVRFLGLNDTNEFLNTLFLDNTTNADGTVGMTLDASGLWARLDNDGAIDDVFYGMGPELRRWKNGKVSIVASNFMKIANITMDHRLRIVVADSLDNRILRFNGRGEQNSLIAGDGRSSSFQRGGDKEEVSLPGASGIAYLPGSIGPMGYFVSLDRGAKVWFVDSDDQAVPFIFGRRGVHRGDGRWFQRHRRSPKISNVKSITVAPSGDIILVEGRGYIRKIEFLRHRP
jgi:hypothetical protein